MSWNFKRGIDHTLNTDNANTYFVDGGCYGNAGGDDTTGDGSSANPWKTLTHAYANTLAGDTIMIAPSEYINQVGAVGSGWNNRKFIGDTLNRDVIIEDTVLDKTAFQNNTTSLENITIKGYNISIRNGVGQASLGFMNNIVFMDCSQTKYEGDTLGRNCIFINSNIIYTNNSKCYNSLFYNSNIINNSVNAGNQINIYRSYFDENSKYIASTGLGKVNINNICHVNDLTTFDNGDSTNLVFDGTEIDEQGSPANWISPSFLDLAVQFDSALITNDLSGNIGNVYRGLSFSPDQPDFITTVTANPDVEIVNSNIQLVSSVPVGESRTVEGFSITASAINRLSTALQIGISVKCEYVFEVRWADPGLDINTASWKPFRLGETMTQNPDGTTTGEAGYDWGDNNFINYKNAQGRLVLTQTA